MKRRIKVAIIGSGNIGTDLMMKLLKRDGPLELVAMVGIDPRSEGLAMAQRQGVESIDSGVEGLLSSSCFAELELVFDATSAAAHVRNAEVLTVAKPDIRLIDLTPAAIGPYFVPDVSSAEHLDELNINMVTCGGQATIPVVSAVNSVTTVEYAEIVASIASRSAGPGTRENIDEFTETTSAALCTVGGSRHGKAIIILNPADPPLMMRDTVYALTRVLQSADREQIRASVESAVAKVAEYVPGYELKQPVQFDDVSDVVIPSLG